MVIKITRKRRYNFHNPFVFPPEGRNTGGEREGRSAGQRPCQVGQGRRPMAARSFALGLRQGHGGGGGGDDGGWGEDGGRVRGQQPRVEP